jgi:threonine synthase
MYCTDNITADRPTFVSHLECRWSNEIYPSDTLHNLSPAGKPLLVRYDLANAGKHLDRDELGQRPPDLWRYRELYRCAKAPTLCRWAKQ